MTKNNQISKHLGQSLDLSRISTISLKNFELIEVKVLKSVGYADVKGFRFVSKGDVPTIIDTTSETHRG